jgi:hypothetical protein
MMRIEDFPRPKHDNCRGVHWSARIDIVGERANVSQDMEAALAAAGCQVRRVHGSIAEITAAFETLTSGPWKPWGRRRRHRHDHHSHGLLRGRASSCP